MEHVVSRADLAHNESSPFSSPEPDVLERFRGLDELEFAPSRATLANDNVTMTGNDDDEGLEFQLFAAPKKGGGHSKTSTSAETHRVRLRSPSLDPEKVGFVRPHRDQSYYFARTLMAEERNELETAAVTGAQVLSHAASSWPGTAYPWKILHLSNPNSRTSFSDQARIARLGDPSPAKKRTRPGKKYRIKIRKKAAAAVAKKEERKAEEEKKEAEEREKRTRRNREKKVKRKAKEKAKKADGAQAGEEGGKREGEEDLG